MPVPEARMLAPTRAFSRRVARDAAAMPVARTQSRDPGLRERVANWLAILVLLALGIVWPPVHGAIEPGGPLRFVETADWIAGAGIASPRKAARVATPQVPRGVVRRR